jgi:hypothetical protein
MAGKKCARCTVAILASDFERGLAVVLSGKPYCKICAERVSETSAQGLFWNRLSKARWIRIVLLLVGLLALAVLILLLSKIRR